MCNRFDYKNVKMKDDYTAVFHNRSKYTGEYIGTMSYEKYLFNINIGYIPSNSVYYYNTGNVYFNIRKI